jgi:hypothetical protein
VGVIAVAGTLGLATLGTGASASMAAHHVARPPARPDALTHAGQNAAVSDPVVAFTQELQKNTKQFCDAPNANPCDGAYNGGGNAQDFGTIDRVPGKFSNGGFGNYAPSTPALTGTWMALVSGDQDINQGTGCPGTAPEQCTGPYAFFGDGSESGVALAVPYVLPAVHLAGAVRRTVHRPLLGDHAVIDLRHDVGSYGRPHHGAVGEGHRRWHPAVGTAGPVLVAPEPEQVVKRVVLQVDHHDMPDRGLGGRPGTLAEGTQRVLRRACCARPYPRLGSRPCLGSRQNPAPARHNVIVKATKRNLRRLVRMLTGTCLLIMPRSNTCPPWALYRGGLFSKLRAGHWPSA